ncbi:MAG: Crp/Fnr family transcriptional regulator [Deltaproteobacteria bacterium]|nr:Crp/Fnr family transcriptional regulator [Deltaproteobacteria bacterium]
MIHGQALHPRKVQFLPKVPLASSVFCRGSGPTRDPPPVGAFFFREGDPCHHFALLGAGDIRVFKLGPNGREITLYHVEEGQTCLVNMLSVTLNAPAVATGVVEAPAEALVIPAARVREWAGDSEEVRTFLFETMARRLMDVMALVEEIAFRRMDRRLADLLLRRLGAPGKTSTVIAATHEELASELGTVREVVSRLLGDFDRRGAVTTGRGRIELRELSVLRSLSVGE